MFGVSGSRVRAFRPVVISVVTAMVASFGVALAPAAHAADRGVSDTVGTLQRLATWSQGLGGVGKLGQALPLLSTSPGAPLGFATALQESLYDELSGATTWGGLAVDQDVTVSGTRHGHLTTSVGDTAAGKRLVVDLTLTGTLASEPLSFADSAGAVRFSASGGVKVDSTLHLQFAMDWVSADNSVYLERGASGPSILVDARRVVADSGVDLGLRRDPRRDAGRPRPPSTSRPTSPPP